MRLSQPIGADAAQHPGQLRRGPARWLCANRIERRGSTPAAIRAAATSRVLARIASRSCSGGQGVLVDQAVDAVVVRLQPHPVADARPGSCRGGCPRWAGCRRRCGLAWAALVRRGAAAGGARRPERPSSLGGQRQAPAAQVAPVACRAPAGRRARPPRPRGPAPPSPAARPAPAGARPAPAAWPAWRPGCARRRAPGPGRRGAGRGGGAPGRGEHVQAQPASEPASAIPVSA